MPVYKDKNNTWYFKCSIKGRQYLKRGFKTKAEAVKEESIFRASEGNLKKSKILTFQDCIDLYFKYLKNKLKPTSYYLYNRLFKKYIIPNFKNIDINKIGMNDFNNFKKELSKAKLKNKNRIINCLKSMFEYLNIYYDINNPYVKRIQSFKNYTPGDVSHEVNVPVEFNLLKQYYSLSNDYFKFYLLTTFIFGLRISEVRGLDLSSFNLNNKILYINKVTTCKVGLHKSVDLVPKSSSSIRKYSLCDSYINKLEEFIKKNNLKRNNKLFFSNNKNDAISETSIRRYLNQIEKDNNLVHITPHGLRHGIATYLYGEGISFEDIGKYLGHKFNSVTMDVYIDLTKERQKNIISKIEKLIKELDS